MVNETQLQALDREVVGELILPADDRYLPAKESFYRAFDSRRPLAVVRVANSGDVASVVRFARETGAGLAVRAGGHSVLGLSTVDGGLLIDLSTLKDIDIDVEKRTVWAGGGVLAGKYTSAVAAHDLITPFGDVPTVGVTGIALGGGVGFLHRKLGLTADSVIGAEIVTADGEVRHIDLDNEPDLFWAIRGGGGNFGVVTRLGFRLHDLGTVLGGLMILPATPRVLSELVGLSVEASDDLSVMATAMVAPPMPFLPEEIHGLPIIMGRMVHAGPSDLAEAEVGKFRKLAEPLMDTVERISFPVIYGAEAGPPHPAAISIRSVFNDAFGADEAEYALSALGESTADMGIVQIRVLGGAVARIPEDATAFAHRNREMIVNVAAAFQDSSSAAEHEAWVDETTAKIRSGPDGMYANFAGDDSVDTAKQVYPGATWERLVDTKTKYDPTNLFSNNINIRPRS